jgi:UDP-N-acetylglucosamine/UDP-N-acetylgalactosamine diphosphorylase
MIASKSMEWISEKAIEVAGKLVGQSQEESLGEDPFLELLEERRSASFERYEMHNQQHVFDHWSSLSNQEKVALLDQLDQIEVEQLGNYLKIANAEKGGLQPNGFYDLSVQAKKPKTIKPFSGKVTSTTKDAKHLKKTCYNLGIDAIKSNKVATILLAGGQGTRLGFDGPKGMYDIGMPSKRTLFCMVAERILSLTKIASDDNVDKTVHIPLYIMTSPMNHEITMNYFESNDFFGLPSDDVKFFAQGTLPCLTPQGEIIMESQSQCAMAPDGNGGIYPAMKAGGVMDDMKKRGIEHVHAFAIDNALVKPADPTFIGYCIEEKADCGNKVVWKQDPHEKVGVIAERDGQPCVIEYSELSTEMAEQSKGKMGRKKKLQFGAANICNHYYSISFLEDKVMPNQGKSYHLANKKIPFFDGEKKETVSPTENNGIKLESFIFDVFPLSTNMAILEVEREAEFAPVKNPPGSSSDSPDTARSKLSTLAKSWLKDVGAILIYKQVDLSKLEEDDQVCEILPLTSYNGEGLTQYEGKEIECPFSF